MPVTASLDPPFIHINLSYVDTVHPASNHGSLDDVRVRGNDSKSETVLLCLHHHESRLRWKIRPSR